MVKVKLRLALLVVCSMTEKATLQTPVPATKTNQFQQLAVAPIRNKRWEAPMPQTKNKTVDPEQASAAAQGLNEGERITKSD